MKLRVLTDTVLVPQAMEKSANAPFSETEKTVIFLHPAVSFEIDQKIKDDSYCIKKAGEGGEAALHYVSEMRKAAVSDKNFIIMDYDKTIVFIINMLLQTPGQYYFCGWSFNIFFHADTAPTGGKQHEMYNAGDEKYQILWELLECPIIIKYAIPVGYTATYDDFQKLSGLFKEPEDIESFEELLKNPRRPPLPYYEPDYKRLKDLFNEQ